MRPNNSIAIPHANMIADDAIFCELCSQLAPLLENSPSVAAQRFAALGRFCDTLHQYPADQVTHCCR